MTPLKTGDPCPCCGMPIKTTNPKLLQLLTNIRNFGWSKRTLRECLLYGKRNGR